jgi:hypothetical protein
VEGLVFLIATALAVHMGRTDADTLRLPALPSGEFLPVRTGEPS